MENWNSANTVLHYGKDGALTGPDKEAKRVHEMSADRYGQVFTEDLQRLMGRHQR